MTDLTEVTLIEFCKMFVRAFAGVFILLTTIAIGYFMATYAWAGITVVTITVLLLAYMAWKASKKQAEIVLREKKKGK